MTRVWLTGASSGMGAAMAERSPRTVTTWR